MVTRRIWLFALSILYSLVFCNTLLADDEDIKAQINRIKSDEAYLGAESTHEDWGFAYLHAVEEIQYYLNLMRKEEGMDSLSVAQVKTGVRSLRHMRGDKYRVFAYVKLQDMLQAVPEPDKTPTDFSPLPDSPSSEETQQVDSTKTETGLSIREDSVETPVIIEDHIKTEISAARQTVSSSSLIEVVMLLRQVQMIDDAVLVLEQFRRDGKVQDFAKVRGLTDIQENTFLIIYDMQGEIQALLEVQQGQYRNIKTNQKEGLDAYHGCAVFWFK